MTTKDLLIKHKKVIMGIYKHSDVYSAVLMSEMLNVAQSDNAFNAKLDNWLSGDESTVFLRDKLVQHVRFNPMVTMITECYSSVNIGTAWFNIWCKLDSAKHNHELETMKQGKV